MQPKKLFSIAPLVHLPLKSRFIYTYLSDLDIPVGSIVSIPFANRNIFGVVTPDPIDSTISQNRLKNVNALVEKSFITQKQLELARWISREYFAPLGIVLKSFVPRRVHSMTKENPQLTQLSQCPAISLTPEQEIALRNIMGTSAKDFFLFGPAGSGKTEVYLEAASETIHQGKQILILSPELTLLPQIIQRLGQKIGTEQIAILHGKLSEGIFFENWQRIRSGKAMAIIGTRLAIFAPFSKLGMAIIDEEQDISYKQWDMIPRYDTRHVVQELCKIHENAKLIRVGSIPRLESLHKIEEGHLSLTIIPPLQITGRKNSALRKNIEIVNMRLEAWRAKQKSRYSTPPIFSKPLLNALFESVRSGSQSLIVVNQQGMSRFTLCMKCKQPFSCPSCKRNLVYHKEGYYTCIHCSFKTGAFPKCGSCGSLEFKNIGIGTQKVEEMLQKMFPQSRIARADASSMSKVHAQEKLFYDFLQHRIDILIGTQMVSKGWNIPNLEVVGILSADDSLQYADFESDERTFQLLMQSAGRVGRMGNLKNGKVFIQTYRPEHPIFSSLSEENVLPFLKTEMQSRQALGYPPYSRYIKVFGIGENEKKLDNEYRDLLRSLKDNPIDNVRIYAIEISPSKKIRGKWQKHILIRIPKGAKDADTVFRSRLYDHLSANWSVDIDPISIN